MQSQYGTDKVKAICQFSVGAAGAPTVKSALNCTLAFLPGTARYQFTLSDGPVVLPGGTTSSGDNDNNTAVVVSQARVIPGVTTEIDITFGPATSVLGAFAVPAGVIEIDVGAAGATPPASGALITVIFYSCYDGTDNTP
jgi:hypothetical protein